MAPSPPSPSAAPSLSSLRDSLDLLLEDYLAHLALYESTRARLHSHLKDGYFDLAKAKLAIGPARVSPQSYDLAEKDAQLVVSVTPASSLAPADGDEASDPAFVASGEDAAAPSLSWAVLPRPAAATPAPSPPLPSASGLRQRLPSSSAHPPAGNAPPTPRIPPSPLTQFSPLPPPSLRASAAAFVRALESTARVVELERGLRERARAVKRARKEVRRWEGEALAMEGGRGVEGAGEGGQVGKGIEVRA